MNFTFKRSDFPAGFEFGVSTSAYQTEGSRFGNCGTSQWDVFAATPGNVVRGENGATACDHYHRWAEDLDLIRDCGMDAYRFSTSWARVMPEGRGRVNQQGLDFYERIVDGLLERGIKPYACLYHWELPAALLDLGGWRNRDIADWFADFTEVVMRRIGDRLHAASTFNEPWCIAWLSHFMGHHAPGLRDIRAAARAMHHVLLAHGRSIQAMRALGMDNLGVVMNFEHVAAADDSAASAQAAQLYDGIYNRFFLGGVFKKTYPEDVLSAGLEAHLPADFQDDMDIISMPVDWFGINYYTRKLIADDQSGLLPYSCEVPGPLEKTAMDWEVYPEGLDYFIHWINREYTQGLPMYITENGMASYDKVVDGKVDDPARIAFIDQHVAVVRKAIAQGVPVKGYFLWSLLDNYEWALGYDKRFGLVHVDFDSLQRTPKGSYYALQKALQC
ncbi:MAG: GH1 family beta-glucosidase [Thiolinea sp.]